MPMRAREQGRERGREGGATSPPGLALLADWRAVWVLTAIFVAVGVEAVISGRALHDEGVLTWHYASILGAAPIPGLFFQKLRPVLALCYAPVAPLGFEAFAVMHVLVAAAGIPLAAAIAQRLGVRTFVVPALIMASSPLMLFTAPGGHSNTDAAIGLLLGMYLLWVKERGLAGGAVLSAMLLVRSEVAPLLVAIALERALARDWRPLVGMALVPGIYALAGSLYHRDLLWMLHYPPTLMRPTPNAGWVQAGELLARLGETATALMCLTPAVGLIVLLRPRALGREERALAVGLGLFLLMIRGFPMIGLFNFDASPRYLLVGLPALALLIGRHSDCAHGLAGADARDGGVASLVALAAATLLGVATLGDEPSRLLLPMVATWAGVMGLSRLGWSRLAAGLWIAVTVLSFPRWRGPSWLEPPRAQLDALEAWWLREGPEAGDEVAVLTNSRLAKAWLEHRDLLARPQRVHILFQEDMAFELGALFDREVGQDRALLTAMDEHFYGRPVLTRQDPLDWPVGTIVIFEDDDRLGRTIDLERWRPRMSVAVEVGEGELVIARLVRLPEDAEGGAPPAEANPDAGEEREP
ncbi:hypothetical protein G6O69_22835 [Pseudenhygromyxa sp. WMMC2535]|uniref:hypothetical protein n=1 Tax=Pseudenhygromyxa sp. WMMC2535 TaxID=2712867 RepID=UPI001555C1F2|nr:hypothetical protein [Pseudenhygromyxa sp. WMMC2535]NVB40693.1 hypothetical protein [Pseudenhygromyxa sp. WMMC2535]